MLYIRRDSFEFMPLLRGHKIAIIILIAFLVISAAVLRFLPAEDSKSLNSPFIADQIKDPMGLIDLSMSTMVNNSSMFVLDFYYPGCGPCQYLSNVSLPISQLKLTPEEGDVHRRGGPRKQHHKGYAWRGGSPGEPASDMHPGGAD